MNCSVCSTEFKPNARFCGVCGASVAIQNPDYDNDGRPTENSMVGFGQAIKLGFGKYADFGGRATRAEYWWWVLLIVLVGWVPLIGTLFTLATFIPSLAVTSRRLHDLDRSGWWQGLPWLLVVVMVITAILSGSNDLWAVLTVASVLSAIAVWILLLVWLCMRGQEGANQYGPDPRTTPRRTL